MTLQELRDALVAGGLPGLAESAIEIDPIAKRGVLKKLDAFFMVYLAPTPEFPVQVFFTRTGRRILSPGSTSSELQDLVDAIPSLRAFIEGIHDRAALLLGRPSVALEADFTTEKTLTGDRPVTPRVPPATGIAMEAMARGRAMVARVLGMNERVSHAELTAYIEHLKREVPGLAAKIGEATT